MSTFGGYADHYDLVYSGKDYKGEVSFAADLIHAEQQGSMDLLEVGCGTAGHAVLLAQRGHRVLGVDRSAKMLHRARQRLERQPSDVGARLSFVEADIATLDVHRRFDAALAFFHVVSYLTEDDHLAAAFSNIRRHLKQGGLFLFDYWYGPAVVAQKPERRVRTFEDRDWQVERIVQPVWLSNRGRVRVDITLNIRDKVGGELRQIKEQHPMRYFGADELEKLLVRAGFRQCRSSGWLVDDPPSEHTWGACMLAEAL